MANKKTGLGRGFESLIPSDMASEFDDSGEVFRAKRLLIQDIIPNPDQPRKEFAQEAIDEMAESIKEHGILQPIIVIKTGDKYALIAGERRWRAAKVAGIDKIPAIIRTLTEQQKLEMALIENIQREDLTPLELAEALLNLNQQFNLAFEEIAKRVGKAEPTVHNTIRLLKLPEPAKRALMQKRISEGHARAILMLRDDEQRQQELLDLILKHGWTVRRAEQFAKAVKEGAFDVDDAKKMSNHQSPETEYISNYLGAPVKLQRLAKGGRIVIDYKDDNDLIRITHKLSSEEL